MLVILDVVTNHMGQLFYYDINGNGQPDDTLSGGGFSHTCLQICAQHPDQCSADELTYCTQGKDYLERIIEWDPDYDPRGVQGWTSLGFSGAADVRFTELARQEPHAAAAPARRGSTGPTTRRGSTTRAGTTARAASTCGGTRPTTRRTSCASRRRTGDFPGGLKDLDTENPDVKEALIASFEYWIEVADFDGFRIDTVKHIDRPEIDAQHARLLGRLHRPHAREGEGRSASRTSSSSARRSTATTS